VAIVFLVASAIAKLASLAIKRLAARDGGVAFFTTSQALH
jgi:hypothetical protein